MTERRSQKTPADPSKLLEQGKSDYLALAAEVAREMLFVQHNEDFTPNFLNHHDRVFKKRKKALKRDWATT